MDSRVSANLLWRSFLLGVAALFLGACASETAEGAPAPPAVPEIAAPVPAPPAQPEPSQPTEAPAAGPVTAAPPPPAERGPVEITGVEVQQAGPGGLVVAVVADGPIATYESFTLPDPPRLIIDLPNATHAIPQPISARPPLVTAIRSSQYRERPVKIVRLVLDLRSVLPYQVTTADNQLRVEIGTGVSAPSAPAAAPAPVAA